VEGGARMTTCNALLFYQPYNVCPRYPDGTRWEVYARGRYFSCAWNMQTFAAAVAYLRQQWANEVAGTKERRNPGDEHRTSEFRGWIDGPGGRMEWNMLEGFVKS
jgi:hypothetical protein